MVVLCAQSLESARVLFNSANRHYADGLANWSGVLGHYLTAHIRSAGADGDLPNFDAQLPPLSAPKRPVGIYFIRFRNTHRESWLSLFAPAIT